MKIKSLWQIGRVGGTKTLIGFQQNLIFENLAVIIVDQRFNHRFETKDNYMTELMNAFKSFQFQIESTKKTSLNNTLNLWITATEICSIAAKIDNCKFKSDLTFRFSNEIPHMIVLSCEYLESRLNNAEFDKHKYFYFRLYDLGNQLLSKQSKDSNFRMLLWELQHAVVKIGLTWNPFTKLF